MQMLALFGIFLLPFVFSKAVAPPHGQPPNSNGSPSTHQPIQKLMQVFGISDNIPHRNLQPPPQYMIDLYHSVADDAGMSKAPNPYNAKIIRSYSEKGSMGRHHFLFNISGLSPGENVLEAELHLYLTKHSGLQPHVIFVYQILDSGSPDDLHKNRLVDVRYADGPMDGWQVFRVQSAVNQWITAEIPNLGFSIVAQTAFGQRVPLKISRNTSRRPVLILFNDDGTPLEHPDEPNSPIGKLPIVEEGGQRREKRNIASFLSRNRTHYSSECHRQELYVDFESIGWSEWIIAPKGYNAYHCSGLCTFPLGQSQRPTNHATVQSIIHEMKLADGVARPCCVPSRLLSLSLLYYDENDNVVLKQYGEMVADSCGCH